MSLSQICDITYKVRMPQTEPIFYQDAKGRVPLLRWFDGLRKKVVDKGIAKITLLEKQGNELRFPNCKHIDGDIWSLRFKRGKVNYRILYAFCGQNVVLLTNGTTKESRTLMTRKKGLRET